MGLFTKPIKTPADRIQHTLPDSHSAPHHLTPALPQRIQKTTSAPLRGAFETHLGETHKQIERLERVFSMHGQEPKQVTCAAMDGIIKEAKEVISDCDDPQVLDAAMLSSAQAVEHYEMTRYGTLVALATQLGRSDCAAVLAETLAEEKATDKKLSEIAEGSVNQKAAA